MRFNKAKCKVLKMSLLTAGGLGYTAFKGPFQPKASYDSKVFFSNKFKL